MADEIRDVFISHSWNDKKFVRRLASDLEARGISVWVDEAQILVGDSLITKIEQAIDDTRLFAVVISVSSVKSDWVKKELEQAIVCYPCINFIFIAFNLMK